MKKSISAFAIVILVTILLFCFTACSLFSNNTTKQFNSAVVDETASWALNFVNISDGQIAVGGNSKYRNSIIFVAKYDEDEQLLWARHLVAKDSKNFIESAKTTEDWELSDGYLFKVVVGHEENSNTMPHWIKYSKNGDFVWAKSLRMNNAKTNESGFIGLGNSGNSGTFLLMQFNANAKIIWEKEIVTGLKFEGYEHLTPNTYPSAITILPNNEGYLIAGIMTYSSSDDTIGFRGLLQGRFNILLTLDGDVTWREVTLSDLNA